MRRILILDKDTVSSQAISRLARAMNLEPLVLLNWDVENYRVQFSETVAVFVNIEMPSLPVAEIEDYFNGPEASFEREIPLVFLFAREYSQLYDRNSEIPHFGELKKPVDLERVFHILDPIVTETEILHENLIAESKLSLFEEYYSEISGWFETYSNLVRRK
jgi:hypothetical protein